MKISMCVMDVQREDDVRRIRREDISEAFVDTAETIIELTHEGAEHGFLGHTFAICADDRCVGVLLLGEAVLWETDPPEMQHEPFYRLMGFIIDREYRNAGIGAWALEEAIRRVYDEFGVRPIALGVHKENHGAERFYLRHGFVKTDCFEGNDRYYLRYPELT